MSTRRSTRATSKPADDTGATPVITAADMPGTPRHNTRRSAKTPLPAVGTRTSTAYGTNTTAKAGRVAGPEVSNDITNVLRDILQPIPGKAGSTTSRATRGRNSQAPSARGGSQAPSTRGGRGRKATPAQSTVNRSYDNESGLFANAEFESSAISSPSDLNEYPPPELYDNNSEHGSEDSDQHQPSIETLNETAHLEFLENLARQRIRREQATAAARQEMWATFAEKFKSVATLLIKPLKLIRGQLSTGLMALMFTLFIGFLIAHLLSSGNQYQNYGWDVKSNIGQFLPDMLVHPREYFNQDEVSNLQSRMRLVEREIYLLKKSSDLDEETLKALREILPELVVVKKDVFGKWKLPDGLWHAIRDKIRADQTLVSQRGNKHGNDPSSSTSVSVKEIEGIAQQVAGKAWENFLRTNKHKIQPLAGDGAGHEAVAFKDNLIAHKEEVLEMIRDNWEELKPLVHTEMQKINRQFEQITADMSKLQHGSVGLTRAEIKTLAKDTFKKMLPSAQLDALINSNLKINLNYGLTRVNHFSIGTGAVVDPHLTSPNYKFPSMDVTAFHRQFRAFIRNPVPVPNPPEEALTKWDEHGDCWCSPAEDDNGFGPSLGVIIGSNIYPEQVVIEHIPSTASLEPGAAPREMELLAYIPDVELYNKVKNMQDDIFSEESEVELQMPYRYARIAVWTYDVESAENVQAFPVQIDLKAFGVHTNKLVIRAKNNHGGGKINYTCLYRVRIHGEIFATPGLF